MKRITRNLFLILLACMVPFSMAFGQEKKNEKKIKIIIDEGSGAKTVLDTVLSGSVHHETITLKDGTMVFIGEPEAGLKHVSDGKKVIVHVESDQDGEKELEESIYVASSDSPGWTVSSAGEKVIVIKDGKVTGKHGESADATKYVIAKDGVVVTVESDDEAKAEEIIKMIESKLGVKSEDDAKAKTETTKTEK